MQPSVTAMSHDSEKRSAKGLGVLQGRLLLHAPAGTCFLLQAALTALQRTAGSKTWPAYRSELLSDAFWAATASHDASLARSEQVRMTTPGVQTI